MQWPNHLLDVCWAPSTVYCLTVHSDRNMAVVMVTRNRATQNELSMNRFASNTDRLGKDASSQTHLDYPFVDGC
ncbi:hypothetical protein AB1N83_011534 [Pleurotus pulmonarius]